LSLVICDDLFQAQRLFLLT